VCGKLFHKLLLTTGNARSPTVVSRVRRIVSCDDDDERRAMVYSHAGIVSKRLLVFQPIGYPRLILLQHKENRIFPNYAHDGLFHSWINMWVAGKTV